ncbi:hypothetical protein Tco_1434326 [Tanacetum coccineum]
MGSTKIQVVDEAFITENYLQLELFMRRRMRALRLLGVAIWLNYSSEDVDEERERERWRHHHRLGRNPSAWDPPSNAYPPNNFYHPNSVYPLNNVYLPNNIYPPNETAQILKLNENQRIAGFVHGVKIKYLIKFISAELPKSYDGLIEKVYSWLQAEETAFEGRPVTFMDNEGEKPQKGRPWEGSGRKNKERRERYSPYKEPNPRILQNLSKTPREILASEKVVKTFLKPPKMVSKTRDTSKYCKLHQYYSHDTNACRELKNQIEEAVRSGKLTHLIKGIRKGKAKQGDAQLEEWIAPTVKAKQATEGKE